MPTMLPSAPRRRRSTNVRKRATPRPWPKARPRTPASQLRRQADLSRPDRSPACTRSFAGFVLATLVAVPLGILCGLSQDHQRALNPLIQIFKPVSPLAWLPIVTMVVRGALCRSAERAVRKSFVISAITVTLCSLWPTLINTALGVASIDKDLLNVGTRAAAAWQPRRHSSSCCRRRCR